MKSKNKSNKKRNPRRYTDICRLLVDKQALDSLSAMKTSEISALVGFEARYYLARLEEDRTVGRAHRSKSSFVVDQSVIAEKRFLHTKEEIKTSLMQKKELLLKYAQKSPRVLQVLADVYGESQDTSYENLKAALEKNVQDPLSRYNKVINALADIGRTFPRLGTLIWRTKSDLWYLM